MDYEAQGGELAACSADPALRASASEDLARVPGSACGEQRVEGGGLLVKRQIN